MTVEKESEKRVQFPTRVEKEGTATTTTTLLSWNRWRRGSRWKFVQRCLQAMQRIYFSARERVLCCRRVATRFLCCRVFACMCVKTQNSLTRFDPYSVERWSSTKSDVQRDVGVFRKKYCSLVPIFRLNTWKHSRETNRSEKETEKEKKVIRSNKNKWMKKNFKEVGGRHLTCNEWK